MKFYYSGLIDRSPETGEPEGLLRPEIPTSVIGGSGEIELLALVDTGADHCVLPSAVAQQCGIEIVPGKGPGLEAYGGQKLTTYFGNVKFKLNCDGEQIA